MAEDVKTRSSSSGGDTDALTQQVSLKLHTRVIKTKAGEIRIGLQEYESIKRDAGLNAIKNGINKICNSDNTEAQVREQTNEVKAQLHTTQYQGTQATKKNIKEIETIATVQFKSVEQLVRMLMKKCDRKFELDENTMVTAIAKWFQHVVYVRDNAALNKRIEILINEDEENGEMDDGESKSDSGEDSSSENQVADNANGVSDNFGKIYTVREKTSESKQIFVFFKGSEATTKYNKWKENNNKEIMLHNLVVKEIIKKMVHNIYEENEIKEKINKLNEGKGINIGNARQSISEIEKSHAVALADAADTWLPHELIQEDTTEKELDQLSKPWLPPELIPEKKMKKESDPKQSMEMESDKEGTNQSREEKAKSGDDEENAKDVTPDQPVLTFDGLNSATNQDVLDNAQLMREEIHGYLEDLKRKSKRATKALEAFGKTKNIQAVENLMNQQERKRKDVQALSNLLAMPRSYAQVQECAIKTGLAERFEKLMLSGKLHSMYVPSMAVDFILARMEVFLKIANVKKKKISKGMSKIIRKAEEYQKSQERGTSTVKPATINEDKKENKTISGINKQFNAQEKRTEAELLTKSMADRVVYEAVSRVHPKSGYIGRSVVEEIESRNIISAHQAKSGFALYQAMYNVLTRKKDGTPDWAAFSHAEDAINKWNRKENASPTKAISKYQQAVEIMEDRLLEIAVIQERAIGTHGDISGREMLAAGEDLRNWLYIQRGIRQISCTREHIDKNSGETVGCKHQKMLTAAIKKAKTHFKKENDQRGKFVQIDCASFFERVRSEYEILLDEKSKEKTIEGNKEKEQKKKEKKKKVAATKKKKEETESKESSKQRERSIERKLKESEKREAKRIEEIKQLKEWKRRHSEGTEETTRQRSHYNKRGTPNKIVNIDGYPRTCKPIETHGRGGRSWTIHMVGGNYCWFCAAEFETSQEGAEQLFAHDKGCKARQEMEKSGTKCVHGFLVGPAEKSGEPGFCRYCTRLPGKNNEGRKYGKNIVLENNCTKNSDGTYTTTGLPMGKPEDGTFFQNKLEFSGGLTGPPGVFAVRNRRAYKEKQEYVNQRNTIKEAIGELEHKSEASEETNEGREAKTNERLQYARALTSGTHSDQDPDDSWGRRNSSGTGVKAVRRYKPGRGRPARGRGRGRGRNRGGRGRYAWRRQG